MPRVSILNYYKIAHISLILAGVDILKNCMWRYVKVCEHLFSGMLGSAGDANASGCRDTRCLVVGASPDSLHLYMSSTSCMAPLCTLLALLSHSL